MKVSTPSTWSPREADSSGRSPPRRTAFAEVPARASRLALHVVRHTDWSDGEGAARLADLLVLVDLAMNRRLPFIGKSDVRTVQVTKKSSATADSQ